jgi:hypothetical protein
MDKSLLDLAGMEPPDDVKQMIDVIDWEADICARSGERRV